MTWRISRSRPMPFPSALFSENITPSRTLLCFARLMIVFRWLCNCFIQSFKANINIVMFICCPLVTPLDMVVTEYFKFQHLMSTCHWLGTLRPVRSVIPAFSTASLTISSLVVWMLLKSADLQAHEIKYWKSATDLSHAIVSCTTINS